MLAARMPAARQVRRVDGWAGEAGHLCGCVCLESRPAAMLWAERERRRTHPSAAGRHVGVRRACVQCRGRALA